MIEEIRKSLKSIVRYLSRDEERHFWENCECEDDSIHDAEDIDKCRCRANKSHIYRDVVKIKEWLKIV